MAEEERANVELPAALFCDATLTVCVSAPISLGTAEKATTSLCTPRLNTVAARFGESPKGNRGRTLRKASGPLWHFDFDAAVPG